MLIIGSRLKGHPVLSLHLGGMVARIREPIFDPDEMKIVAFWLEGPSVGKEFGDILETGDIREVSDLGLIVDSDDAFVRQGEVIKLDKIIAVDFELVGKKVVTKKGTKLGRIVDYMVDRDGFTIHQFIVRRPILKSFLDPELIIGRSEIVSADDTKIVVRDEEGKIREKALEEDFTPDFVNPFRKQPLAQVDNQSPDELDTE